MGKGFLPRIYKSISIKTKLMLIAIIFIVYPIVILGYFGYRNYADMMQSKAIKNLEGTARELTSLLSDRMANLSLYTVQILYDNRIYNANRDLIKKSMDFVTENEFTGYLQSTLFMKSELTEILVSFTGSRKIFQVNKSMGSTTDSFLQYDNLYKRALDGKGKPVWYVSFNEGKATGIYLTKIIYDINDIKKELGLLVFKVSDRYIAEVLSNYLSNTEQNVSLFDSEGREVFAIKPFQVDYGKRLSEFLGSASETLSTEVESGNDKIYLMCDTIKPDNWKLVMGISSNVLLKDVRDTAKFILILCIATLPICILLVNFLYTDIIRPMNLLIKKMQRIEKGDIGVTIESDRGAEFGYVYRTFNKMSQEIKNLINTVYKNQIATKDAEIKALQAQINPHFLYNTLDSINWKAKLSGVTEISEMVTALSCIIEANLNRKNENFIELGREIEYINNYYLLLQKRFGKKIRLVTDISEDTLNYIIPKLIIQPIIENAVHHGLEMKLGTGTIHLKAGMAEEMIYIEVRDDGTGIEENTLKSLQDSLDKSLDTDTDSNLSARSSIGIINVHKRIKLLYGEEYGLKISSRLGEGTAVSIRLPAVLRKA